MITLKDKNTNRWLGQISYDQLKFLNEELSTEYKRDQDYRVNRSVFEQLKSRGADAHLTAIIEKAISNEDSIEFYWVKS